MNATKYAVQFVAVDFATGCHLRNATAQEVDAYNAATRHPCDMYVRVGDVCVYPHSGPGVWFGGAGF